MLEVMERMGLMNERRISLSCWWTLSEKGHQDLYEAIAMKSTATNSGEEFAFGPRAHHQADDHQFESQNASPFTGEQMTTVKTTVTRFRTQSDRGRR